MVKSPLNLLKEGLQSAEVLSGEIDGYWKVVDIQGTADAPMCIISVSAKDENSYHLRFDLTNYNEVAPTAQLWDLSTGAPLTSDLWPQWSKRCMQVFRAWGNPCLYLPCDRLAFTGHPDWPQLYPGLVWRPGNDTIFKYLNEVHQILN